MVEFGVSREHFGSWMVGLALVNWDLCFLVLVFSFEYVCWNWCIG